MSLTNKTKTSGSLTNIAERASATLTNKTETSASLIDKAKSVATLVNKVIRAILGYLLKEDGFYLLQENGGRIILNAEQDLENKHKISA